MRSSNLKTTLAVATFAFTTGFKTSQVHEFDREVEK
jgi:hypothetical protein